MNKQKNLLERSKFEAARAALVAVAGAKDYSEGGFLYIREVLLSLAGAAKSFILGSFAAVAADELSDMDLYRVGEAIGTYNAAIKAAECASLGAAAAAAAKDAGREESSFEAGMMVALIFGTLSFASGVTVEDPLGTCE